MSRELLDSALEGETLQGNYYVQERVAMGGMAWIYKAIDLRTQTIVALKILFSKWNDDEKVRERFMQEVRIHMPLKHPNIIRVDEAIEEGGLLGMAMEWVDGGDLKQFLEQREGPLTPEEILDIFFPMAEALGYAHRHGIVHRDIKPGNVMLAHDGHHWIPKWTDFGIAKASEDAGVTMTGAKLGTPYYMAPEQWKDSKRVDLRADIYSLGVILYRMLTGELPFSGDYQTILVKLLDEPAPYPKGVPAPLAGMVLRCLEKEPGERFDSCDRMLDALSRVEPFSTIAVIPDMPVTGAPPQTSGKPSTLAYMPSYSKIATNDTGEGIDTLSDLPPEMLAASLNPEQEISLVIPDDDSAGEFLQNAHSPMVAQPRSIAASQFQQTYAWSDEPNPILEEAYQKALEQASQQVDKGKVSAHLAPPSVDEDYQKAIEKAKQAAQKEQESKLETVMVSADDPALRLLKMLLDGESQPNFPSEDDVQTSKSMIWLYILFGILLLATGGFVGWWLSR